MSESCGGHPVLYCNNPLSCTEAMRRKKHYFVKCPFCDPRDNKVDLYEACEPCYWNRGILTTGKDLIPDQVSCHHGHTREFLVEVLEE